MYIGNSPLYGTYDKLDDISSTFNGVITEFDCLVDGESSLIGSANNLIVVKNGLMLDPDVDYIIGSTGRTIVFDIAPLITDSINIRVLGHVFSLPSVANGTVTTSKIVDANVTLDKLASNSVNSSKIVDSSVTTSKIVDANVTLDKLASNSVNSSKIIDGSISEAKHYSGSASAGDVLVSDGSGGASYESLSSFWAYDSGEFAVPVTAGKTEKAHSLSYVPSQIIVDLVCKTIDVGYAVGDVVQLNSSNADRERTSLPASQINLGYSVGANATNIFFSFGAGGQHYLIHATTGVWTAITTANWKMRIRAR